MSAFKIMALDKGNDSDSSNIIDYVHMEVNDSSFSLKWVRTSPPTERVFEADDSN